MHIPLKIKKKTFIQNLIEQYATGSLPSSFTFIFTTNDKKKKKATEERTCEECKTQSRITKLLRVTDHFSDYTLIEFKKDKSGAQNLYLIRPEGDDAIVSHHFIVIVTVFIITNFSKTFIVALIAVSQ
jgi:hypothetical protein